MPPRDDLTALLDRVAEHRARPGDLARLRRLTRARGEGNMVQVGGYNVALRSGRDIHLGDRLYRGADADAIRELLREVAFDGTRIRRGPLRGLAGFVLSIGMLAALTGMALFLWGLVATMQAPPDSSGIPTVIAQGFGLALIGVVISTVGAFISGWQRPRRH